VYDETGALPGVLSDLGELAKTGGLPRGSEILIVDDGSAQAVCVEKVGLEESGLVIRIVRHPSNMGYGAAVKTGLRAAAHEVIVLIDGDGTYPVNRIPDLLSMLDGCDMAVAARTGANVAIPAERRLAKWVLQKIAEYLAGQRIPDLNSGLRAFRRGDALIHLGLYPRGFSFTTTISLAYLCTDRVVSYLPVDYYARVSGESKIRPLRDTQRILMTIVRSVLAFNPLRVFFPLALLMFILAMLVLAFVRDEHGNVTDGTVAVLLVGAMIAVITGLLADMTARARR
jgi:glycosyltransferase involved in cell wall biosynthesis